MANAAPLSIDDAFQPIKSVGIDDAFQPIQNNSQSSSGIVNGLLNTGSQVANAAYNTVVGLPSEIYGAYNTIKQAVPQFENNPIGASESLGINAAHSLGNVPQNIASYFGKSLYAPFPVTNDPAGRIGQFIGSSIPVGLATEGVGLLGEGVGSALGDNFLGNLASSKLATVPIGGGVASVTQGQPFLQGAVANSILGAPGGVIGSSIDKYNEANNLYSQLNPLSGIVNTQDVPKIVYGNMARQYANAGLAENNAWDNLQNTANKNSGSYDGSDLMNAVNSAYKEASDNALEAPTNEANNLKGFLSKLSNINVDSFSQAVKFGKTINSLYDQYNVGNNSFMQPAYNAIKNAFKQNIYDNYNLGNLSDDELNAYNNANNATQYRTSFETIGNGPNSPISPFFRQFQQESRIPIGPDQPIDPSNPNSPMVKQPTLPAVLVDQSQSNPGTFLSDYLQPSNGMADNSALLQHLLDRTSPNIQQVIAHGYFNNPTNIAQVGEALSNLNDSQKQGLFGDTDLANQAQAAAAPSSGLLRKLVHIGGNLAGMFGGHAIGHPIIGYAVGGHLADQLGSGQISSDIPSSNVLQKTLSNIPYQQVRQFGLLPNLTKATPMPLTLNTFAGYQPPQNGAQQ